MAGYSKTLDKIAAHGCCVCRHILGVFSPAEIHHVRHSGKRSNAPVIPLCPYHHRTGGYGGAIHAGLKKWEECYGTESWYVEKEPQET